jgi:imidazole glycerol-phosphate synthase subunit HisH
MRVTVLDYGAGNLHSLRKALAIPGVLVVTEADPARAIETDVLVLPGVGAFGAAAARLAPGRDLMRSAINAGLPTLGICLGMQLLFEASEEGPGAGLAVLPGRVRRIQAARVPHIGWNAVVAGASEPLLGRAPLDIVYYANGFVAEPADSRIVTLWSEHEGDRFAAAVRRGRTVGVQFHPEKSSLAGVEFVRAFLEDAAR